METHEIPKDQWTQWLTLLTRQGADRPIRIEVENRDIGDQLVGRQLPLIGIALDEAGSEAINIEVSATEPDGGWLGHRIEWPMRLYMRMRDGGEVECLEIEDARGGKTLIFFEQPLALPRGEARPSAP